MTKTYRAFTQDGNIIIKYDNGKNLRDVATITTKKGNELNVIFPEKKDTSLEDVQAVSGFIFRKHRKGDGFSNIKKITGKLRSNGSDCIIQNCLGNIILTNSGLTIMSPDIHIKTDKNITLICGFKYPASLEAPHIECFAPNLMNLTSCDIKTPLLKVYGYGHFNQVSDLKKLYAFGGSLKIPYLDRNLEVLNLDSMTLRTEKCEDRISADKINFNDVTIAPQDDDRNFVKHLKGDIVTIRKMSDYFLENTDVSARRLYLHTDEKSPSIRLEDIEKQNLKSIQDRINGNINYMKP